MTKTQFTIPDKLEGPIQLQILRYLKHIGAKAGKTGGSKGGSFYKKDIYNFNGFPDLTCFFNSTLYFIECKKPTGTLSSDQTMFRLLCSRADVHYIVARRLDDVMEVIK